MALFKDKDLNLPLLTQFRQLSPPCHLPDDNPYPLKGTELDAWVLRTLAQTEEWARNYWSDEWPSFYSQATGGDYNHQAVERVRLEQLLKLARLYAPVSDVMDAAARGRQPNFGSIDHINEAFRLYMPLSYLSTNGEKLYIHEQSGTYVPLAGGLLSELAASIRGLGFGVCESCGFSYPRTRRSGQKFCSWRCGNRAAQKAQAQRKKAAKEFVTS